MVFRPTSFLSRLYGDVSQMKLRCQRAHLFSISYRSSGCCPEWTVLIQSGDENMLYRITTYTVLFELAGFGPYSLLPRAPVPQAPAPQADVLDTASPPQRHSYNGPEAYLGQICWGGITRVQLRGWIRAGEPPQFELPNTMVTTRGRCARTLSDSAWRGNAPASADTRSRLNSHRQWSFAASEYSESGEDPECGCEISGRPARIPRVSRVNARESASP